MKKPEIFSFLNKYYCHQHTNVEDATKGQAGEIKTILLKKQPFSREALLLDLRERFEII